MSGRRSEASGAVEVLEAPAAEAGLAARYAAVRAATDWLTAPLSPEDAAVQAMPDASPAKWHLAHTSWFFETFVLAPSDPGFRPFHPDFRVLFNSYYNSIGAMHPRAERGLVTRPGLAEVRAYRAHVDGEMARLLAKGGLSPEFASLVEIGLQHEQQHQELILTDLKYLLSRNPLAPVYRERPGEGAEGAGPGAVPLAWRRVSGGLREIGFAGPGFAFDNEGPRHRVYLEPFELASRLVTAGEYLEFMADGGYRRPELWLSDGWAEVRARGLAAPLYWEERDGGWTAFTLAGERPLDPAEPVCHLSYYEADAYARWAGVRLPTEAEWEVAAADLPVAGNFVESRRLHPAPAPAAGPALAQRQPGELGLARASGELGVAQRASGELGVAQRASGELGVAQLFGDVWEWTASPYVAYPGYRPAAGALGEYNGKFMCNQLVLRGGSCATPASHVRATYRNFFPPGARWQFSGIRLARDAG